MFNVWNVLLKQALMIVMNMCVAIVDRVCRTKFHRMITEPWWGQGEMTNNFSNKLNDYFSNVYFWSSRGQSIFTVKQKHDLRKQRNLDGLGPICSKSKL